MSRTRRRQFTAIAVTLGVLGWIVASASLAPSQPNPRKNDNPCTPPNPQSGVRPGWGHGDKNHDHTGPPGQCVATGPTTTVRPTTTTMAPTTTTVAPTTTTVRPTTTTMAPTTTTSSQGAVALRVTVAPTCITPGGGIDVLVQAVNSAGQVVTSEGRAVEGTVNGQTALTGWTGNYLDHTPAGLTAGVHRFDPDHGGEDTFGINSGAGWALSTSTGVAPGTYTIGANIPGTSISGSTTLQVATACGAGAQSIGPTEPASASAAATAFPALLGVGLLALASLPLSEAAIGRMLRRRRAE